jgi:WD40 repeat protein
MYPAHIPQLGVHKNAKRILLLLALYLLIVLALPAQAPVLTLQLSHGVRSMAITPNAKYLVTAGDNTVKMWDLQEKRLYRTLVGHTDRVMGVSISPDGKTIASASFDRTIKLWDAASGIELRTLKGHTNAVLAVRFSPDGRSIASGGLDRKAIIWDAATGNQVRAIEGNGAGVLCVAWSTDGGLLATGNRGEINNLKVFRVSSGEQVADLVKHTAAVFSVDFSRDGKYLAAGSQDLTISVWDAATRSALPAMEGHKKIVYSVSYSADGKYVASGGGDARGGEVKIWPAEKAFEPILSFSGHNAQVSSVIFSPDSKTVFSGSFDQTIRAWDLETGKELYKLEGLSEAVYSVQYSPDGRYIGVVNNSRVFVRVAYSGKPIARIDAKDISSNVSFSGDGRTLAAGFADGSIRLYESAGGRLRKKLPGGTDPVIAVALSPDGETVYAAIADRTVRAIGVGEGRELGTFKGGDVVTTLALSADGKTLVGGSTGKEKTVCVWDAPARTLRKTLAGHTEAVMAVAVSGDGGKVASGSADKTVRIWDANTGATLFTLAGHQETVTSVAFNKAATLVASSCGSFGDFKDRSVRIWDVATGKQTQNFMGHQARVYAASFSPDGNFIVSGSEDTQLKVWDPATGKERVSLVAYADGENYVVYSADGKFDGTQPSFERLYYVQGLTFLPLQRFFDRFYTPELWSLVLGYGAPPIVKMAETKPIEKPADKPADKPVDKPSDKPADKPVDYIAMKLPDPKPPVPPTPITKPFTLPPLVEIGNPRDGQMYVAGEGKVKVSLRVTDQGGGIDEVRLYINDKLMDEPGASRGMKVVISAGNPQAILYNVQLASGLNVIKAVAFSKDRVQSKPAVVNIQYQAPMPEVTLWVVSVGINQYLNKTLNLNFAKPDASAIVAELEKRGVGENKPFDKIVKKEIYDAEANLPQIRAAFKEVAEKAKPEDVFVFFYAGHGMIARPDDGSEPKDFYLVLNQVQGDYFSLVNKGLSAAELQNLCTGVPAQSQLIMIDACESGKAVTTFGNSLKTKAVAAAAKNAGTLLMASTDAEYYAYEFPELGHGVFTYSFLQGLEGKAPSKTDGDVTVGGLKYYIDSFVPGYTETRKGRAQVPNTYMFGKDFAIGNVK